MPHKTLAIVALSHSMPDEHEEDFDAIWTINNAHDHWRIHTDRIIAMDDLERDEFTHPEYVKSIVDAGVPVLSTEPKKKWPSVEAYPLQKVCDFLKSYTEKPWRLLDNTCNYALALAMAEGYRDISAFGVDWCHPYKEADLACALVRFKHQGFKNPPDWFKYYHPSLMLPRRNAEPGSEAWHFLMGVASATGVDVWLPDGSTITNSDRDKFFYGYQGQPNVT